MNNEAKLKAAARLVSEVVTQMNRNSKPCECCGLTVYENHSESLTANEMDAVIRKLERWGSGLSHRS